MKITAEWVAATVALATLLTGFFGVLIRWALNGMRSTVQDIKEDTQYIKQTVETNRAILTNHEGRIGCLEGMTSAPHSQRKVK